MPRWFLSYHSPDKALAEQLKAAVERKDSNSRVFFSPTDLRAGGAWTAQLAQGLAEATAFILLVGPYGIGKWQVPEYYEALDKWVKSDGKFPLIVVILEGQTAPGLPFLRQIHWVVTADPSSETAIARLFDSVSGVNSSPSELWRYASPYRGLEAMQEKDSDYFFGRELETVNVLSALAGAPDQLPVLIGNSGVGKSSLAQAGVLAALKRQAWPQRAEVPSDWPVTFQDSRQWCYLSLKPGTEPLKALAEAFIDTWQYAATDPARVTRQYDWTEALRTGRAKLSDLVDATERRRKELEQPIPPGFLLYIDQGEELYVRAEERQRQRFSELLVQSLSDPRLRAMMSMRSDFLGHLQNDEPLFKARLQIDVPPLRETELREVISSPARLLDARFETESLIDIMTHRAAEDAVKDVGALPLLSYTLDDMWASMVQRGDGTLRLPAQSFELGGVLVDRANRFLETHPGAEDTVRRVLTLRLATVREDGEPTRRRAARAEFSNEEWQLVSQLADYPNKLLVTVTTRTNETYAEVAHEAIFRRWDKLREWIATEREFLSWRNSLEAARRAWQSTPDSSKNDALLAGFGLGQAKQRLAKRATDIPDADRQFIVRSGSVARARQMRLQMLFGILFAAIIAGVAGWWNQAWLKERVYVWRNVHVLAAAQEKALKPGDLSFKECTDCPEMVVVPAGSFTMGSPEREGDTDEHPQHRVTIARPFAVSKFELTFAQWDACWAQGGCPRAGDSGFGRGQKPVINVNWDEATEYVAWLSRITGKPYRLLSESEYEYAARGGTQTVYPWGDDIKLNAQVMANCDGCGSEWSGKQTAPVGSFTANAFGLNDMAGNVWEWTEDCYHATYKDAPSDGSAWTVGGDCTLRVLRAGSWYYLPSDLRSARRHENSTVYREYDVGFRVARTLTP